MTETLCWTCANACKQICPWADEGKPVDGWVAEKGIYVPDSYNVLDCPLYKKDQPLKDLDDDGVQNLVAGIIRQLVADYEKEKNPKVIPHYEKYVRSDAFRAISNVDPERLIYLMRIKRKARLQKMLSNGGRV